MEDRLARARAERHGLALTAFAAILVITAAWWALAFYPAGASDPEWLARTRSACFGSANGGLPDAGGWLLLIGEPIGMVGVLFAVWGREVRRDMKLAPDEACVAGSRGWHCYGGTAKYRPSC